MKKIIYTFIFSVLLFSCAENENVTFDAQNGKTALGFDARSVSVVVPANGVTEIVGVKATTISNTDRSFTVNISDASTGSPDDYTIGNISIPANSYDGTLEVTFGNFANLQDLITQQLILEFPQELGLGGKNSITFNYVKYLICNDLDLVIDGDTYGSETSWDITDSTGAVVQSGGPYTDISGGYQETAAFTLPDGDYIFTIYDAFGDGLYDGNVTGTYKLSCSILTFASGGGNFGSSESTNFTVNP